MVDEKIKQQIIDTIKARKFFTTKRVGKELDINPRLVSYCFIEMEKEGLIKRWNKKQWTWEKT